mgnify:CR=1 FL=1
MKQRAAKPRHDRTRATPKTRKPPRRGAIAVGDRVEIEILIDNDTGSRVGRMPRPAFGYVVALDQVAVTIDGEREPRAFEPSKVKPV